MCLTDTLRNVFTFLNYISLLIEVFNSYLRILHIQRKFKKENFKLLLNKDVFIYKMWNHHNLTYLWYFIVIYCEAF